MLIAAPTETDPWETRVAATPETVKKFVALGAEVAVEHGAGAKAGFPDAEYQSAGARLVSVEEALGADVVLKVRRPNADEVACLKPHALVIATMDPYGHREAIDAMAKAGVAAFAMELLPRITRAQSMDVLSSQANLAGYRAVIDASAEYGRAAPMMMTPAGTVPAAKLFVMRHGSRSSPSAPNSSLSRTRSSSRPKPQAATQRKCRTPIRPSRPTSSPRTSPSRTSSSPPR
jgi:NAD(P) transhydrogenase subunit alpha